MANHAMQLARFSAVSSFASRWDSVSSRACTCWRTCTTSWPMEPIRPSPAPSITCSRVAIRSPRPPPGTPDCFVTRQSTSVRFSSTALRLLVERSHVWYLTETMVLAALNTPLSFVARRVVSYLRGLRPLLPSARE